MRQHTILWGLGGLGILVLTAGVIAQTAPTAKRSSSPSTTQTAPASPKPAAPKPAMAVAHAPDASTTDAQAAMVKQYCATCHSEKGKAGGLSLAGFDPSKATDHPDVVEKMIRKLRAGMMPPPLARRPDGNVLDDFTVSLENRIDAAAALRPNPGSRTFQRLNRAEYARSIRELLDVDVDINAFLPPDTMSAGFDNIADVQNLSPTTLEGFMRAASKISTLALGDRGASPSEVTFKVPRTQSQNHHIDGTPWGTRGGISV